MDKLHDIVETSKMSMEYNGALIDVERDAGTDLDNGRLVVREGNTYVYPSDENVEELFLITTPEKTYEDVAMTEFYNKEGRKVRAVRVMLGDQFGTTSVDNPSIGDVLMVNNEGRLVENVAGAIEFEVIDISSIGGFPLTIVERIK